MKPFIKPLLDPAMHMNNWMHLTISSKLIQLICRITSLMIQ